MSSTHGYHEREYWEEVYGGAGDTVDDWLQTWPVLAPLLRRFIGRDERVLELGCGNSTLSESLHDAGYHRIDAVDFSEAAIRSMRFRATGRPGLVYHVMDARALTFDDATFDAVIDKGTLDAIFCGAERDVAVRVTLSEVARVLSPRGQFISISLAPPRRRLHHLLDPAWGWHEEVHAIPKMRPVSLGDPEFEQNYLYLLSHR